MNERENAEFPWDFILIGGTLLSPLIFLVIWLWRH